MRLLTPGPASSLPPVLDALSLPLIHHRTKEFQQLYCKNVEGLQHVFATSHGEVAILSGSGTTGLEAGIVNAFEEGDTILIVNCGYFGERLTNIANTHKLNVISLTYPWNGTYDVEDVKQSLNSHPEIVGLLMVYSETSTGALHDIASIGRLLHEQYPSILFLVDCISGLVMNPFYFDDWHIDIAVAASQKGFFLPPGLAFVCLSPKAIHRIRSRASLPESFYMNLMVIIDKYHDNQKIGSTPNIAMMQGLGVALDILASQPLEAWNQYYHDIHEQLATRLADLGLLPFSNANASNSLLVCCQENAFAIRNALYDKTNVLIEVGLGMYTDRLLRIGCMNGITMFDALDVCRGLEQVLLDYKEKEMGNC